METELAELREQMTRLTAELKLMNAKHHLIQKLDPSPWLSLNEAAPILRFKSARALRARIINGQFPPDCFQRVPTPSGKRNSYLINVQRYLKKLN